jgi:hypothetical protein
MVELRCRWQILFLSNIIFQFNWVMCLAGQRRDRRHRA